MTIRARAHFESNINLLANMALTYHHWSPLYNYITLISCTMRRIFFFNEYITVLILYLVGYIFLIYFCQWSNIFKYGSKNSILKNPNSIY